MRKWLSPPSAWIGSMISAATSSRLSTRACFTCASASASTFFTRSISASSTGKRSFGLTMRGHGNFGKYIVFRGSAVFVSERV